MKLDSLYATNNHFADRDLVTMVKIRMTTAQRNITGSQEVIVISQQEGTQGAGMRSEVLYFDFWGYDFTKQESYFFNSNQQLVASLPNNPITISTPCIANKTHSTLFFAYGNKESGPPPSERGPYLWDGHPAELYSVSFHRQSG